jgi:two-component system cell cycle sensor histidine kinase/response regulator CckA
MRDAVLDGAFDAFVLMSPDGAILDVNAAAERLFDIPRAQAIGRDLATLIIADESRQEYRRAVERHAAAGTSGAPGRLELHGLRGGTATFPLELSLSRIASADGPMFTAWIRDVTERRAAEEALRLSEIQLRQALKMEAVGRLAGGVAHDFNNVLTAILGYADLLLDGFIREDPRRADIEEIKRAATRAAGLTHQLLAFSRKQVMQPRRLNLNDVVRNVQKLLAKLLGDDIVLRIDGDPAIGDVKADPGQIEQVLMNLVANARDAMPDGGHVSIATANHVVRPAEAQALVGLVPGSFVTLTITDTGHGIPPHVRSHIFEPFFTTKAQGQGTGLGLATVYGIVKQSGGWIYLDETPGPGASFRIFLPRLDAHPA